VELGINFFDTADVYSLGRSEEILGRALRDFGPTREELVIATKVFNPMGQAPNQRGLSRKHIMEAQIKQIYDDMLSAKVDAMHRRVQLTLNVYVTTNGYDIIARYFSASGAPVGSDFTVNTFLYGDQFRPKIASGPTGCLVVWTSMGQEYAAHLRSQVFAPFRVTKELMATADSAAVFMNCLPAHRGQEVADEVIDSRKSVVYDQAENRLHVQKALMLLLMQDEHA